jgi:hypothetical protein
LLGSFLPRKAEAAEVTAEAGKWAKLYGFSSGFVFRVERFASETQGSSSPQVAGRL